MFLNIIELILFKGKNHHISDVKCRNFYLNL